MGRRPGERSRPTTPKKTQRGLDKPHLHPGKVLMVPQEIEEMDQIDHQEMGHGTMTPNHAHADNLPVLVNREQMEKEAALLIIMKGPNQ